MKTNDAKLESSYPLSPMQQGMLIHSLGEKGTYVQQMVCSLGEDLNVPLFRTSWQSVFDRHTVLRTSFHWEDVAEPLQKVHCDLECPFTDEDWRAITPESQQERFHSYLSADRQSGFETAKAPLMRVALFRMADCDYRMVWTFHHALLDGRSDFLVLKEVFDLYDASCDGQELELEQLRPFSDYIERLAGLDLTKSEAFWGQTLHGITAPPVLGQTADVLRESEERIEHASVQIRLSEELTSQLRSLAKRSACKLNNLIQASWALLIGRYTREEEVVFGVTRACRHWAGESAKSMVGMFINTLPLRVSLRPEQPLVSFLEELRAQHITLRDYEHSPLTRIHGWSQVPRNTPLFDTVLVFEDYHTNSRFRGLGERWAKRNFERLEQTNYPLTLAAEAGRDLILKLEYDKRRFGRSTVEQMLNHLEALLKAMADDPDRCIGELSMLTEEERRQLLVEWNQTRTDYPKNRCLQELFEAQVQRTPDAVAVTFGKQSLSYRELNGRANQLANHLRSLGVGPEVIVGICVERSLELMIGLLGILKAGGAYLPLDAAYPHERLAYVFADAKVRVLVTQAHLREIFANESTQLVCVDADWKEISVQDSNNPKPGVESNNVAYVIHTSGSTGKPKGTLIEHSSLINYLTWFNENIGCKARLLPVVTSPCFDASLEQIFAPLLRGDEVWMLAESTLAEPAKLLNAVATRNDVAISVVPSVWRAILDEVESSAIKPVSLRYLLFGGEQLSRELADRSFAAFPKLQIWNLYGPTETTCSSCSAKIFREGPITIGRPIGNTQIYILDPNLQPVPVGVPGEIHIGGAGLSRGYLNRPQETVERFIPSPFSECPGDRLYKSGDLARYLPNGDIEFLDRIDDQVKIRGLRIELGEIEAALCTHPAVRESVVIVREDPPGDKRLVAYLVPNDKQEAKINELRSYLKQKLPEYMVPSDFVTVEQFQLTPNGKLDRKGLPAPDSNLLEQGERYIVPRTAVEELLAGIWTLVLGLEQVGINDDFFSLGGHSLLATQIISRIRRTFEVELPLRALFGSPTVAGLARLIETARGENQQIKETPLVVVSREEDLPLSFAQQRLWFLDKLEQGSATYNIPLAIKIKGGLNVETLRQALEALVARHESLRSTFDAVDGRPVMVIAPTLKVTLPVVDLAELPEDERQTRVQQLATEESQVPFDLSRGPLFRVSLLRLGAEEHVVLVTMHHIISDEWSLAVFFRELGELYEDSISGRACSLPELAIQYADFAVWRQQWLQGEVLEKQLHYWREQLQGAPALLALPADHSRPAVQSHRGAHYPVAISGELVEKLKALSRREGVTLYMTLLAAFKTLLLRHTNQEDIVVGTSIANRNRTELEGLIGIFVDTLALRTDLSGDPSFRELLGRVREVTLGAYDHQDMPFEKLVDDLQPERSLSYNPLFQVLFGLHNAPTYKVGLSGLTVTPIDIESGTSKFDLSLDLWEVPQGISGTVEYNTDLFAGSSIERLMKRFETLLGSIVADPEQRISVLPLLPETERRQLLLEWNNSQTDFPRHECIHELFEAQVLRTPDAVALIFDERRVTYAELNRRANQMASYLRNLGVGPEVLVGICVERSVELIVGILGTLKAGGAYVPLDPAYPKERVTFMMDDSEACVLLTQQEFVAGLSEHLEQVVCLDRDWNEIARESEENLGSLTTPSNLAYVIYTSGSTGNPKGVAIEHRSTVALLYWATSIFTPGQLKGVLASTSVCFDLSVYEIFAPLSCGGTIVLVENVLHLASSPSADEVTLINTVPTAITELLRMKGVPASVRTVNLAGEPLKTELVQRIYELGTVKDVFDLYGPTEDTTYSTFTRRRGDAPATIGRPISNTQAYILDSHLQPVPAGIPGELYLGGEGLARGYLNRPELTDERFVRNPFSKEPNARLHKTGDLTRYLPAGEIEYLGRIDNQVKVRGFRIELGEIEAVISQYPAVRENVVIAKEDRPGDKRLVAYLVLNQMPMAGISELRSHLEQTLPAYMVPSAFVELESLPLTPNGKIDRQALPEPDRKPQGQACFIPPRDEIEVELAHIWARVLGHGSVGVRDNFFGLGGNSLLAARMFDQANQVFGKNLPLATLFHRGTIEQLATLLRHKGRDRLGAEWSSLVAIQPDGTKRPFFCVHGVGGNVLVYRALARYLAPDQPLYGLQSAGLDGKRLPHTSVEEMAAHYIAEVSSLQPEGPYLLGGLSFGGVIAFEMARQLQRQGREVRCLALLDTPATFNSDGYGLSERIHSHFGHVKRLRTNEWFAYIRGVAKTAKRKLRSRIWRIGYERFRNGQVPLPPALRQIKEINFQAAREYVLQPYSGRVALFRAGDYFGDSYRDDDLLGWDQFASEVDLYHVPGDHVSMVNEPHVQVLAEKLRQYLDRAASTGNAVDPVLKSVGAAA